MNKDTFYSGKHGECSWDIETNGTLIIYPTNGKEGMLANQFDFMPDGAPWLRFAEMIKSVCVDNGVAANKNAVKLFADLKNCKEMDLSRLDASNTINMDFMFANCRNLRSIDLSNFDFSNAECFDHMFDGCKSLKELNFGDGFSDLQGAKLIYKKRAEV